MRAGCLLALRTLVALADDPLAYESGGGGGLPDAPQELLDPKVAPADDDPGLYEVDNGENEREEKPHRRKKPFADTPHKRKVFPGTRVPIPVNFADYARGHPTIPLYGAEMPGKRISHAPPGRGLPGFWPKDPESCPEQLLNSSKNDPLHICAPDGESKGQFLYNVWTPTLVVYQPGRWIRTDAAVVVAPGGGFRHLDWNTEGLSPAEWFASLGITAFILKYRVPDLPRSVALMDAQRAMSLVRHLAPQYGINKSRIGFFGASASGQLGIQLSIKGRERRYERLDEVDDQPFKPNFLVLLYPMIPPALFPIHADPEMPPTVLGYSFDDPCCLHHATDFFVRGAYENWQDGPEGSRKRNIFHIYENGGHGWSDCLYYPYLLDINAPACFFKENFVRPLLNAILSGKASHKLDLSHWAQQRNTDGGGVDELADPNDGPPEREPTDVLSDPTDVLSDPTDVLSDPTDVLSDPTDVPSEPDPKDVLTELE